MASLFILLVISGFVLILVFISDIWEWISTKDEVSSVDGWDKFRKFGEENRKL